MHDKLPQNFLIEQQYLLLINLFPFICIHRVSMLNIAVRKRRRQHRKSSRKSNKNWPNKCKSCEKSYKVLRSLQRHQKYECGKDAQFQCELCDHKSKHKSDAKKHFRYVHMKMFGEF